MRPANGTVDAAVDGTLRFVPTRRTDRPRPWDSIPHSAVHPRCLARCEHVLICWQRRVCCPTGQQSAEVSGSVGQLPLSHRQRFESVRMEPRNCNQANQASLLVAPAPHQPACQLPANQPTNQPASQPASQPTSQPANQPASQPTSQPTNEPTTNQPTNQPTNKPKNPGFLPYFN